MDNDLKLDYVLDPHGPSTKMFSFAMGPGHLIVKFHERHPLSEAMARLLALEVNKVDELNGGEEDSDQHNPEDALRVIRGLVASYVRSQAESDSLSKFEETRAMDLSLNLWSEKAAYILEVEE